MQYKLSELVIILGFPYFLLKILILRLGNFYIITEHL